MVSHIQEYDGTFKGKPEHFRFPKMGKRFRRLLGHCGKNLQSRDLSQKG